MLQVFVAISQKFCCREQAWAMQNLIRKKEKNGQVSEVSKTMGTQMFA